MPVAVGDESQTAPNFGAGGGSDGFHGTYVRFTIGEGAGNLPSPPPVPVGVLGNIDKETCELLKSSVRSTSTRVSLLMTICEGALV